MRYCKKTAIDFSAIGFKNIHNNYLRCNLAGDLEKTFTATQAEACNKCWINYFHTQSNSAVKLMCNLLDSSFKK